MTPRQFRASRAWKTARDRARASATVCAICGGAFSGPPRSKYAASVDHVRPLSTLDLSTEAGRAIAVDPSLLRVVHVSCNGRHGQSLQHRGRVRADYRLWLPPPRA